LTTFYLVLRGFLEWLSGADNLGERVSGGLSVYMTYAGLLLVFVPVLAARPRLALAAPVVLAAFFFMMPESVRDRFVSSFDPTDVTMRDRLVMWKAGGAMVGDHPLFGVGPSRVKVVYPVY